MNKNNHNILKHVNILGSLFLAFNVLTIIVGFIIHYMLGTMPGPGDTWDIGEVFGLIVMVFSLPGIICGYGLLTKKYWSRTFGIVLSCLYLLNFPFATAVGVYGLWVLLKNKTVDLFTPNKKELEY